VDAAGLLTCSSGGCTRPSRLPSGQFCVRPRRSQLRGQSRFWPRLGHPHRVPCSVSSLMASKHRVSHGCHDRKSRSSVKLFPAVDSSLFLLPYSSPRPRLSPRSIPCCMAWCRSTVRSGMASSSCVSSPPTQWCLAFGRPHQRCRRISGACVIMCSIATSARRCSAWPIMRRQATAARRQPAGESRTLSGALHRPRHR